MALLPPQSDSPCGSLFRRRPLAAVRGPTAPPPSFPGADQAQACPRRPHQRIRASRVDTQVKPCGRVLEPRNRLFTGDPEPQTRSCTKGSTASWLALASTSQHRPCGRSSRPAASTPPAADRADLVTIPALPGRGDPGVRLLHGRPARRQPGLCPSRDRARDPAHHQRISPGRMTWTRFSARTSSCSAPVTGCWRVGCRRRPHSAWCDVATPHVSDERQPTRLSAA